MRRLIAIIVGLSLVTSVLTGVVVGARVKSSIDASTRSQQHRLFVAQVNGCSRQNVRQVALNRNALATWRFDTLFASALTRPQPGQPQPTAEQRKLTIDFRNRLQNTVATLTWTPVNRHCDTGPTDVQLPVSFAQRQPAKADLSNQF